MKIRNIHVQYNTEWYTKIFKEYEVQHITYEIVSWNGEEVELTIGGFDIKDNDSIIFERIEIDIAFKEEMNECYTPLCIRLISSICYDVMVDKSRYFYLTPESTMTVPME